MPLKRRKTPHSEKRFSERVGWLRAAVLGASDGIVSTASLIMGVLAADVARGDVLIAGIAAVVAGAMSMATGVYISVSSQSDSEKADLEREKKALAMDPESEQSELTEIYVQRGLSSSLAKEVAVQLMNHDALGAHARDELGLSSMRTARPVQAAVAAAASFSVGGAMPLCTVLFMPTETLLVAVAASSLVYLALLGYLSARVGGANVPRSVGRVTFWGALAMMLTAAVGSVFGIAM